MIPSKYQYFTGVLILILVSRFFVTIIDIVYWYHVFTYILSQHRFLVTSVFSHVSGVVTVMHYECILVLIWNVFLTQGHDCNKGVPATPATVMQSSMESNLVNEDILQGVPIAV